MLHFCSEHQRPVYFRYQVHFPVSDIHRFINMSKGSSCQYPTYIYIYIYIYIPVGWSCTMRWLHFYRRLRGPSRRVPWIWWWGSSPKAFETVVYPFIAITLCSTLAGVVAPVRVSSMGQIELFNHLWYLKPFSCRQTNDLC